MNPEDQLRTILDELIAINELRVIDGNPAERERELMMEIDAMRIILGDSFEEVITRIG